HSFIDKVQKGEVNDEQIAQFMPVIYKKLAWLEREELIKHFVSIAFNRFLTYYENAPDINVDESHYSDRDSRRGDRDRGRRRDRNDRGGRDRDRGRRGDRYERGGRSDRGDRGGRGGYEFSRFFFNMGKKNGISKRTIIDLINQNMPGKSVEIGNIEVLKGFSFFEIDKKYEREIISAFRSASYKGQRVGIEIAGKKK
ncbi:MAG: DbpA RNA binding domain-containing protein, partial [Draconibacterium sp.]|nr:DbpA RNA binding domain-containing protein [Draconibacterium sp.]